jgi:hypothetical protein
VADSSKLDENRPVLALLTSHWLSMLGSALVTIAGCSWLFLVVLHAGDRTANPYAGILIFFAVPAVFFAGLILIPIGAWLARRNIQAGLAQVQSRRVALRRLAIFFGVMTVVNVVIASQVTYRAVARMESDQFCGQSCHVMKPQFTANRRTAHRNVGCVECHIVPGAAGFIAAKMNGTKQLIEVTLNDYPRPVPPALQSNRLASSAETCEKCHSRATDAGSPLRVISKFKDDEANTPIQTVLVMNVGGGGSAGRSAGGIHGAHLGPGVQIRYRADSKRQVIPSVEYRNNRTHETRTYTVAGASNAGTEQFLMQCADCHNRQGHAFEQPEEAVDSAIAGGRIPAGLPFAHKTAVEILKASYSNEDGIPAAFSAFYRQKYPDIASKRAADITSAGQVLLSLYQSNVYPDLGVKWGTYPNNLGHADNAGCFRCHDENHATPQKKTISQDCSLCHNPLAVEETSPAVLKTLGLDQKLSSLVKQ